MVEESVGLFGVVVDFDGFCKVLGKGKKGGMGRRGRGRGGREKGGEGEGGGERGWKEMRIEKEVRGKGLVSLF